MENRRGEAARAKWRGIVAAQAASGETVAGFCRDRGLCTPHFFWWKKRLAELGAAASFVELRPVAAGTADERRAAPIEVRLGNGRSLLVPEGFAPDHLKRLLLALEPRS